ncbi:putative ATP synthase, F1 complex, gamma subunit [Helianthus annuus]|uniref:Putative ATPase, F1 complex, gamma subunit, ATPase, F1 complex, gamma subunit domain protein n=1 Tax=Helianthus annuus TaxID=4232 RepID=A0A251TUB8_HELAN|nr:putative ATP synthase, F1 complex, gamma subunit [Helianthus annuus]KAJ0710827.1 putative ATP synthase, F1 complex, gamma subunit [Helianthus annuus]
MVKKNVIVTISSDCGGINSTSVKISRALHKIINSGMIPNRNFSVSVLADDILKNVEFDALRIVFNQLSHFCQQLQLCCLLRESDQAGGKIGDLDSYYEIEGGETKSEVFQNLAEFQFSCVMFNAVLENACSEQGARMSAMDSSSRNAGDMLDRLTLTYNSSLSLSLSHTHTERERERDAVNRSIVFGTNRTI